MAKFYIFIILLPFSACLNQEKASFQQQMTFTESQILKELDLTFKGESSHFFPKKQPQDYHYNFFLDLEHGYCETVGSRIHLYADTTRWAIVFEKSGYFNRSFSAEIELDYVGNCIDYKTERYGERNYISNSSPIVLITVEEFQRIENKGGKGLENFEVISPTTESIKVRDIVVPFEKDFEKYRQLNIPEKERVNPKKLIGFSDFLRYLHATQPNLISATEADIKKHIPKDLPKILTIEDFHFRSIYDDSTPPPSQQELFELIAKVLKSRNKTLWQPTEKPNNHWSNWESGHL